MKYKTGDVVRVKPYDKIKFNEASCLFVDPQMTQFCEKSFTVCGTLSTETCKDRVLLSNDYGDYWFLVDWVQSMKDKLDKILKE